jgi:hypothetical protein
VSIKALNHVWENSKQKGGKLLCLLALADYSNEKGVAFPSIDSLARKSRMSIRNVQLVIGELVEEGEIAIQRGQGPHGCNLYIIRFTDEKITPENFTSDEKCVPETASRPDEKRVPEISPNPSGTIRENRKEPPKKAKASSAGMDDLNELINLTMPENLSTPDFRDRWRQWVEFRMKKKRPSDPSAMFRSQVEKLSEWGLDGAIEAIRASIMNDWQGLFPPKPANVSRFQQNSDWHKLPA